MKLTRAGALVASLLFIGSLFVTPAQAQWPLTEENDSNQNYVPDEQEASLCDSGVQNSLLWNCVDGEIDWVGNGESVVYDAACDVVQPELGPIEAAIDQFVDLFNRGDCVDAPNGPYWQGPNVTTGGVGVPPDDDGDNVPNDVETGICGQSDIVAVLETVGVGNCDDQGNFTLGSGPGLPPDSDGDNVPDPVDDPLPDEDVPDPDEIEPGDLDAVDQAWAGIEAEIHAKYCSAFEILQSNPATGFSITYSMVTQNGDTTILDRDGDGLADAGRFTITNPTGNGLQADSKNVWVQCDYVWGPISQATAMVMTGPIETDPAFGPTPSATNPYFDGTEPDFRAAKLDFEIHGTDELVLKIVGQTNSNETHTTITLNATKAAAQDDTAIVLSVVDPVERYIPLRVKGATQNPGPTVGVDPPGVTVPDTDVLYAPIDLNYIIPLRPNDIDGDGISHHVELVTGPEHGRLPANPFNRYSIPGDADGDACPYVEELLDDRDNGLSACFPFDLTLLGMDSDALTDDLVVWDNVTLGLQFTKTAASLYTPAEARVSSYDVYWTKTNSPSPAGAAFLCSGTDLDVLEDLFVIPCMWNTTSTKDTVDETASPNGYFAWFKVCIVGNAAGSPCRIADVVNFVVQNKPKNVYNSFADLIEGNADDDKDGWISDIAILDISSSHPGHDITKWDIDVTPCRPGQTAAVCDANAEGHFYGTILVDDPNVTLTDAEDSSYEIVLDTEKFPRPSLAFMTANSPYSGVKLKITTHHAGGTTRESSFPPGGNSVVKVFNNRAPEITISTAPPANGTANAFDSSMDVTFSFHYFDEDATAATDTTVFVDGEEVGCTRVTAVIGSAPSYDSDYTCKWDAKERDGKYPWNVTVFDSDRGLNNTSADAHHLVNLTNAPPTLTSYDPVVVNSPDTPPGGTQESYEFRVRYQDTQSAAKLVQITIANETLEYNQTFNMVRCLQQSMPLDMLDNQMLEQLGVPLVSSRDADYCSTVALQRGADWKYDFGAIDIRGAPALNITDRLRIDPCPTCQDADDAYNTTQVHFGSLVDTLNGANLAAPVSGWTVNQYSELPVDDDGDFVPALVEETFLETSIFTVDPDTGVMTFEEEWSIAIMAFSGPGSPEYDYLRVTVSSEQDSPLYQVALCGAPDSCIFEDQDVSFFRYEVTPGGFVMTAYRSPSLPPLLRIELDTTKLSSETEPAITVDFEFSHTSAAPALTVGGAMTVNVFTNPFDVTTEATGSFAPLGAKSLYATLGPTAPRIGVDRDPETGEQFVWVDPDGIGPTERIELKAGGDVSGLYDADADGQVDAVELGFCLVLENYNNPDDGHCTDDNADGIPENHHPAGG